MILDSHHGKGEKEKKLEKIQNWIADMRFIVLIFTFLLQSQSQPIQETNESETEIVCPDTSSKVNLEISEKNDNGKLIRLRITIVLRRL